jgi:hypothetical protein
MLSVYGTSIDDTVTAKIEELDGQWWKTNADSGSGSSIFSGLANMDFSGYTKVVDAYKKNPFLVAEKTNGNYSTSGDVYKISINKDKYDAFRSSFGDESTDAFSLGTINVDGETEGFVATVSSSFFGGGVLTGIYQEQEDESFNQKVSIDFEHAIKTAPTDAKDVSEMETIINSIMGYNDTDDENSLNSNEVDTGRRNDYSALSASITNYMTNNNGKLPAVGTLDAIKYINDTGKDQAGNAYVLEVVDFAADYDIVTTTNFGQTSVYVVWHATCEDNELAATDSDHAFAVYGSLDDGVYCSASN